MNLPDRPDLSLELQRLRTAQSRDPLPDWVTRARRLRVLEALVRDHRKEIADAINADFGNRPAEETDMLEVFPSLSAIRHALRHGKRWMKPQRGIADMAFLPARIEMLPQPLGVVGIIVPWNYPLFLAVGPLVDALAAGNRVMVKMSEYTPRFSQLFADLLARHFQPDEVLVVNGDASVGQTFAGLPFDHLLFTGSTAVGHHVMRSAAANLTPVTLELGGKSPAIVFPDADLELAIAGTASAIFYNQGQCCTAGSRLFAHKSVYDKVVEGMVNKAGKIKVGHGLDPSVQLGPLVSKEQHTKVAGYIESGRKEGVKVETGGGVTGNQGYFVEPTVLTKTNRDMRVVKEEIFGPVVCVQSFDDDDLDQVAKFANDTEYGLQASIWTHNLKVAHSLARKIKAGTICVNSHNYGDPAWPFGGFKQSGWGREMGKEVMEHYTETKSVAINLV